MVVYNAAKTDNRDYWVHISSPRESLEIIADMPETVSTSTSSEWESRLPYRLTDTLTSVLGGAGEAVSQIASITGYNDIFQYLSYSMWTDSTPIDIPLELIFDAKTSPYNDVYRPIMDLASLALPIGGGGHADSQLKPPGPLGGGEDGAIHVRIGKLFAFFDCILISAEPNLATRLGTDGYPIQGDITLTLRTSKIYGRVDWKRATSMNPETIKDGPRITSDSFRKAFNSRLDKEREDLSRIGRWFGMGDE